MTNREFREELEARTTRFAVAVFLFLRDLPYDVSTKVIAYQLGKSASSIGANYHEANRSESRDDFVHKIAIAVKEANESCYWFKVLVGVCGSSERLELLSKESIELRNLLQSIQKNARPTKPHHS
ncbi:MAG: four helix bundle protein [Kiritimatiellae bacterium]|nr:four helix bundle protein [Kiritimatiellia bacterium]